MAVIVVGWFVYYPIVDNFIVSTTDEDIFTGEMTYVGLANYSGSVHDPIVWVVAVEQPAYAVISIVFQVFGAFLLAAMIEGLTPNACDAFLASRLLRAVGDLDHGDGPAVLLHLPARYRPPRCRYSAVGLGELVQPWLGDEHTAIYAIIAMSQWQGFGYSTLLFAVAIQKIPRELYDAAIIDGAGPLRRLWNVTFPLTREMTGLMIIITVTGAFQVFNEVMVMTAGGPNNSSQVLGTWLYQQGFNENNFGYGCGNRCRHLRGDDDDGHGAALLHAAPQGPALSTLVAVDSRPRRMSWASSPRHSSTRF